ncbi:hypothetical protein R3P38DRAFT_1623256 [Favolaschia claudopus]|uniref:Uncharacterized protein n=1 Tax=Favolaschia claudopus TaxID=2862362 RepID=A0AAW0AG08_9AGAR
MKRTVFGSFSTGCRDAVNFLHNGPTIVQQGYDLYSDGIFRIASLFRWEYAVLKQSKIKELAELRKIARKCDVELFVE